MVSLVPIDVVSNAIAIFASPSIPNVPITCMVCTLDGDTLW